MAPYAANTTRPVPIERGARRNSISPMSSPSSSRSNPVIILDKKPIYTGCTFTCPSSDAKRRGWKNASKQPWNKTQEELSKLAKRRYEKNSTGRRDVTGDIAIEDLPIDAQYQVEDWVNDRNYAEPDQDLYEWQTVMIKQKAGIFGNRNAIDVILKRSIRADLRDGQNRRRNSRTLPRTRSVDDLNGHAVRRGSLDGRGDGLGQGRTPSSGNGRGSADDMMGGHHDGPMPRNIHPPVPDRSRQGGHQTGGGQGMAPMFGQQPMQQQPRPQPHMPGQQQMPGPRPDVRPAMNVSRPDMGVGAPFARHDISTGVNAPRAGIGHDVHRAMPHAPQPPFHGHPKMANMHDNIQIVNSDSESEDGISPVPNNPRPGAGMGAMPPMPAGATMPQMAHGAAMPHISQGMPQGMGMPQMGQGIGIPHGTPAMHGFQGMGGRPSPVNTGMPRPPMPNMPGMQQPNMHGGMHGQLPGHQPQMKPAVHQMGTVPGVPLPPHGHTIPQTSKPKGQKNGKQPVVHHEVFSDDESIVTSSSGDCTVRTPRTSSSFGEEVPSGKKYRSGDRVYREHRRRRSSERRERRPSDSGYVVVGDSKPRRAAGVGPTVLRRGSFEDDVYQHRQHADELDRRERKIEQMQHEIRDNELRQREREYEKALRNRDARRHQEKLDEIDRKMTRLALEERDDRQGNYARGPGARYGRDPPRDVLRDLTRDSPRDFAGRERDFPREFDARDRDVPREYGGRERDFGASPRRSTFRERDMFDDIRSPLDDDLRSGYSGSYGRRFERRRDDMY